MADDSSDPAAAWRKMLGDWEKNVNSFASKAMAKDDFARLMGGATGATTSAQGAFADVMQRYLSTMNLPSRAEVASIGERLQAIEGQIAHLTQLIVSIPGVSLAAQASVPKPARTRQPPSATASATVQDSLPPSVATPGGDLS